VLKGIVHPPKKESFIIPETPGRLQLWKMVVLEI